VEVGAEFTFHEQRFKIDTDPWDYALLVITRDERDHLPEMQILRQHIEEQHKSRLSLFHFLRLSPQ
jgi:hypothetical protein